MALTHRQLLFTSVLAGVLTHPYARYVTVVVYQCPLQGLEIKLEDVIVYWGRKSSAVRSETLGDAYLHQCTDQSRQKRKSGHFRNMSPTH